MKKIIVTTSINYPTKAIHKFDQMKDWLLIVVTDKKTPKNYKLRNGIVFNIRDQIKFNRKVSKLISWNTSARRSLGFMLAYKLGAEIVATVDDDNIPKKNWGKKLMLSEKRLEKKYITNNLVFDPISVTNHKNLWHRGYPLQLVSKRSVLKFKKSYIKPDFQADFWDGDPDVDAIERMIFKFDCNFNKNLFPFFSNKFSPFNSQNTFISRRALRNFFMFPGIGRMEDIWASYYAQAQGLKVIYGPPSVFQKRNFHDYTIDFENEYIGYLKTFSLIKDLKDDPENIKKYIPLRSYLALKEYQKFFDKN